MNNKHSEKLCSKMINKFGVAGISKLDEKTYNYEKMKFIEEIEAAHIKVSRKRVKGEK